MPSMVPTFFRTPRCFHLKTQATLQSLRQSLRATTPANPASLSRLRTPPPLPLGSSAAVLVRSLCSRFPPERSTCSRSRSGCRQTLAGWFSGTSQTPSSCSLSSRCMCCCETYPPTRYPTMLALTSGHRTGNKKTVAREFEELLRSWSSPHPSPRLPPRPT